MSLSTAKVLRLLAATVVVGIFGVTVANAQDEKAKKTETRSYENDKGTYHYFEIPPKYDIRESERIKELNARYKKDYKLLSKEEAAERRDANKKTSEAKAERRKAYKLVQSVLEGERPVSQYTQALNYWFERIVFAEMTQSDTGSLQNLPELRTEFFRYYTQAPRLTKTAHDFVVAKTLNDMKYIAENNFHPAVRYHAMLMIGELNGEEALPVFSPKAPPVPYGPALPVLINNFTDDKQIEAVRVAALLGIQRHAELSGSSMGAKERDQIIDVMLATLDAPQGNRTASGHAWIQRRAIDVLGALGSAGPEGKVAKRLMSILNDNNSSLGLRCSAAVAYGSLNFDAGADPEVAKFAALLGKMVTTECHNRLDWLTSEQERRKERIQNGDSFDSVGDDGANGGVITATRRDDSEEGGPGGYDSGFTPTGPSVFDNAYTDTADPEKAAMELERHRLKALRRRIKYPLFCAQVALGGELKRNGEVEQRENWKLVSFLKDEEDRDFVAELVRKLNALQVAANAGMEEEDEKSKRDASLSEIGDEEVKLLTEEFKKELTVALLEVETTLSNAPASARPAAPAEESSEEPAGPIGPGSAPAPATPARAASGPPTAPAGPPMAPAGPPMAPAGPPVEP